MTQQDNYYDRRSARLRPRISVSTVAHEVLPCLTLAFETIDKVRLKNSLVEYVMHLPRMINLSETARGFRRGGTYDEIRGQIDVVKRAMSFLTTHREYAEKSMPLAQTSARNRPSRLVRETRLKL